MDNTTIALFILVPFTLAAFVFLFFLAKLAIENGRQFWIGGESKKRDIKFGLQIGGPDRKP